MRALDLAMQYLDIFFNEKDPRQLKEILDEDFNLVGPFHRFSSADEYIESLIKDPPRAMNYKLLHQFSSQDEVCLIYQFTKGDIKTRIAQYFSTKNQRIAEIILIFDSADFHKPR